MERPLTLKTATEIAAIRRACRLAEDTLRRLKESIRPGVSTLELDRRAVALLQARGARVALHNGFPGNICVSIEQVAVHGIPSARAVLRDDDLLTIDLTVELDGWCADAAWTYLVGEGTPEKRGLLAAAWRSCLQGIAALRAGGRMGDVGQAIQAEAAGRGCRVIEEFVGHGIGRRVHEAPLVPHVGTSGTGQRIIAGMVLTVEPTLTLGAAEVVRSADGWSLSIRDGAPAAQFEHTVAVFAGHTEILTLTEPPPSPGDDFPPYY